MKKWSWTNTGGINRAWTCGYDQGDDQQYAIIRFAVILDPDMAGSGDERLNNNEVVVEVNIPVGDEETPEQALRGVGFGNEVDNVSHRNPLVGFKGKKEFLEWLSYITRQKVEGICQGASYPWLRFFSPKRRGELTDDRELALLNWDVPDWAKRPSTFYRF